MDALWTNRLALRCKRKRKANNYDYILDVQGMRKQVQSITDRNTERWIKAMTIARKMWGCHQRPERSFFVCGYQFPICARCTGVLIGYLCSLLLLLVGCLIHPLICLLLLAPLIVDGGIQLLFNILSNNTRRVITGIVFGIGFIQLAANVVNTATTAKTYCI